MADLDELTDELYLLPPAEFVAGRKVVVDAARTAGDKVAASALAALRKPTVTAWLCNLLVRTHPDLVTSVVDLGADLRDATIAGDRDALRELGRRRNQLFTELVRHARVIADQHGQAMNAETQRELESTLTAAASDPASAEQLLSGRLTAPLTFEGFGFDQGAHPPPSDPDTPRRVPGRPSRAAAVPPTPTPPASARTSAVTETASEPTPRSRAVEEAEQALAVARLQHADADAELAEAERVAETAQQAEQAAAAEQREAQAALVEAQAALAEAQAAHTEAKDALADARADVQDAKRDVAAADKDVSKALTALERATRSRR